VIGDIFQPTHLLFVLVVALLVLGPKRLPEVGRSLGRGIRDFRHAMSGDEVRDALTVSADEVPQAPGEAATRAEPAASGEVTSPIAPAETAPAAAADASSTAATVPVEPAPAEAEPAPTDATAPAAEAEPEPVKQNVA
jgi:sec-independent protein translocase protein TatA